MDQNGIIKTNIDVAGTFDLYRTIEFVNGLYKLGPAHEFIFDFKNTKFFTPFAMLYLAYHIRHIRFTTPNAKFFAVNHESQSYLSHMGFYKSFGLDYGKQPGEAKGSSSYVPITTISLRDFRMESFGEQIGDHCDEVAKRLTELLLREKKSSTYHVLSYSIREMLRNVVEHSEATEMSYCAQYWHRTGKAEISVIDNGMGVWGGLSTNPYLKISSHNQALNLALLPGISGKHYKGIRSQPNNQWQNTGFGLYVTSRICSENGVFFIGSGDTGLNICQGLKTQFYPNLIGTVVSLVIETHRLMESQDIIQKIVDEGFELKKQIDNLGEIEGEKASMMVTEQMKKSLK